MALVFLKSDEVRSSWVDSIAFCIKGRTTGLAVLFKNGFACFYPGYTENDYRNFKRAASKGKWVWRRLYYDDYEEITFDV